MIDEQPSQHAVAGPASWFVRETIELTAADLRAHVVAAAEPVRPGTSVEAFADAYGRLLRTTLPEYVDLGVEPATLLGGRPAVLRRLEWTPPGGRRVTQLQVYAVDEDRGYVATATTQAAWFERVEQRLRTVLQSIELASTAGPPMPTVQEGPDAHDALALERFERGGLPGALDAAPAPGLGWDDCAAEWSALRDRFSGA